jgi:NDP-sugar pyrophosphorylase family protein
MQAVILAAGVGKRLQPLTNDLPKPMVKLNGIPILEHTFGILPKEIEEVILVVGYKKEKIMEHFGDSYGKIKIRYAIQQEPKGTAHALDEAKPYLNSGHFLFLYGDDLYHPEDLNKCIGEEPMVLVKASDTPERFGVCIVNDDGILTGILEKRENPPGNLVNVGVYLLNHEIFDIPKVQLQNGEYNLAEQIGLWAKTRPIRVVEARFWHPIGYPEDIELAERFLNKPVQERLN